MNHTSVGLKAMARQFWMRRVARSRFVIDHDEVHDTTTNLTWLRHAHGIFLNPNEGATVYRDFMTYQQALNNHWGDAWRLPTLDELLTLLTPEPGSDGMHVDTRTFPDVLEDRTTWYWTENADDAGLAWAVSFQSGTARRWKWNTQHAVRLVRHC